MVKIFLLNKNILDSIYVLMKNQKKLKRVAYYE